MGSLSSILVIVLLLGASIFYMVRQVLIFAGFLKGPLLYQFERYGDAEPVYYPLPGLFLALAAFMLVFGFAVEPIISAPFLPYGPPFLLVWASYAAFHYRHIAYRYPRIFRAYPRWLSQLREYTTREERRRIASSWRDGPH